MEPPPEAPHPGTGGAPLDGLSTRPPDLRRALLAFYDARARDLPWRGAEDPYAVWVSEVMLQQTRVETVVPYYRRWLERWPTVEALAAADRDEVLKAWEGLGYYRRARMLHDAAAVVCEEHGGRLPRTAEGLRALPGVGAYTSAAVASIAFGEVVPVVDGNVRRVLARLLDLPAPTPGELAEAAGALVDPDRPGDANQALMELGATVCTPRSPDCPGCPFGAACLARARGVQEARPAPKARTPVRRAHYAVLVAATTEGPGPRLLLERRPEEGLLGGLWAFPSSEVDPAAAPSGAATAAVALLGREEPSVDAARRPEALGPVDHAFTHLRARYLPWLVRLDRAAPAAEPRRWADPGLLGRLALPVAQRAIADAALRRLGEE